MNIEDRFAALVEELTPIPEVSPPGLGRGFGATALRYENKIFAMLAWERLVVKLPRQRVTALVAAGEGVPFDANKGTLMKEWFSLDPDSELAWSPLAREALHFLSAGRYGESLTGHG